MRIRSFRKGHNQTSLLGYIDYIEKLISLVLVDSFQLATRSSADPEGGQGVRTPILWKITSYMGFYREFNNWTPWTKLDPYKCWTPEKQTILSILRWYTYWISREKTLLCCTRTRAHTRLRIRSLILALDSHSLDISVVQNSV